MSDLNYAPLPGMGASGKILFWADGGCSWPIAAKMPRWMPSGVRSWPLWGTHPPARYWFPILPAYPNHPTPQVMYKAEYDLETSLLNCRIEHKTTDRCQVTMVEIWTSKVIFLHKIP